MSGLNRIQVGDFNIQNSITIDELKNSKTKNFISIEEFFEENIKIALNSKDITHFINGVKLSKNVKNGVYSIYNTDNSFIGIGIVNNGELKRDIVIYK